MYWVLGIGYCVLGIAYWVLCIGCCVLGTGYWILCIGYCVLGIVYWVLCIGYCVLCIVYCVFQVTAATAATAASQEVSAFGKAPGPSRPGTKYPVRGIPHFDIRTCIAPTSDAESDGSGR